MVVAVLGERLLVADGVQPGRGHYHRLGAIADLLPDVAAEVLDDDLSLLREVVLVQADETRDRGFRLGRVIGRIVRARLLDLPLRFVGYTLSHKLALEAFP